jgi:hypothetical protein
MADKGNITNTGKGETPFKATWGDESESFGTFAEASRWLEGFTDQKEPAASEMTPEDAEEINSDVRQTVPEGVEAQSNPDNPSQQDVADEAGSGNREAPHKTKTAANDKK